MHKLSVCSILSIRIKEVLKRENEERQRELRDLEAFVKKENAERKAAEDRIQSVLDAENEKRMKEAAALKDKMEKEKKEMQVMTICNRVSFGNIVYHYTINITSSNLLLVVF